MVAMSYFCRENVSQISLEKVANCSHPSEILALETVSFFLLELISRKMFPFSKSYPSLVISENE